MSNTQKASNGSFSLEAYKAKAKKTADAKGPFQLVVDPEHTISIERPDANHMFQAEEAIQAGSSRALIEAICGDDAEEILALFGVEDYKVLNAFGEDLQKHFEIGV